MNKGTLFKFFQIGGCVTLLAMSGGLTAGSVCEGEQKIEGTDGNHTYAPGGGDTVTEVCIKAGRDAFVYQCGQTDTTECYTLEWTADCTAVSISGGGTSRYCKSISHTAAVFGEGQGCEPTEEVCDEIDNNCNGLVDEGGVCGCIPLEEICNGVDDNCNGLTDEGGVCDEPPCDGEGCEPPPCDGEGCEPPPCDGEGCEPPPCDGEGCEPPPCDGEGCDI